MPIYSLLRMKILIGRLYCIAVDISCIVICTDASPAMSITSAPGCANCPPHAAGSPQLPPPPPRQAIAHGAQPPAGHPAIGLLELEALRRPHLVLADFR